jgi:hypothetical protein
MGFKVKRVYPHIYHICFDTVAQMANAGLRLEEWYESPKFKGKTFTREEYIKWFSQEYKTYSPYVYADGINIPDNVFRNFRLWATPSPAELKLLEAVEQFADKKFIVILTHKKSHRDTFNHELAHGFYYIDPFYRWRTRIILSLLGFQFWNMVKFLKKRRYGWATMLDEMHAHLVADYKVEVVPKVKSAWVGAIATLLRIYFEMAKEEHNSF